MKKQIHRFTLYAVMVYLTSFTLDPVFAAPQLCWEDGTHCGVTHNLLTKQLSDQFPSRRYARNLANLDVGEPRTVRMIYFLPTDRSYDAATVQQMKDAIPDIQTFFAQQMEAHGYGYSQFRIETDPQGEPVVHRVDGKHPESHYLNDALGTVVPETERKFDLDANIYLIVLDNSSGAVGRTAERVGGIAQLRGKNGGVAMLPAPFNESFKHVMAHELGHAFGLQHDFHSKEYLMSYGIRSQSRLSPCHAEFLSVHPYFNSDSPIEEAPAPTIELISPGTYPAGSESVPVHLELSDPDGLHQVLLFKVGPFYEFWGCRGLANEKHAIAEFDYDGYSAGWADWAYVIGLADFEHHGLDVLAVDKDGNVSVERVRLSETEGTQLRPQTLEKISGDNQQGGANAQLAQPLIVEVKDQHNDPLPNARVTFAIIAGEGRLNNRFRLESAMTGANGRAEKTLTVGTGRTIVEVSIQEIGIRLTEGTLTEGVMRTRAIFNAIGVGAPTMSVINGDYQKWHLPEGASMRLGKGRIGKSDRAVAFSSEGRMLAVASIIGVWLYDAATSRELALLPSTRNTHSVAFSTNGKTLAAGVEGGVILWDIAARTQLASLALPFPGDVVRITSVSFSSDERTIAFMSSWAETVKLWHVATGEVTTLKDLSEGESGGIRLVPPTTGPTIRPQSVSFSPDGRLLASGSIDGTVKLWDVGTQTLLAALSGHRLQVNSVSFSRDGRLLASGSIDETVKLWDVMKKENIATLRGHSRNVNSVAFSPDGTLLASGASGSAREATIKLWDIASGHNINTFATLPGGASTVSFSPDGSTLASGSINGTVKLWNVGTGDVEFEISGHTSVGESVSFSSDGSTLASGSTDGTAKLWDVATGQNVETFGPHAGPVNAVSFSPDGSVLASGSDDNTVKLWNIATGTAAASRFTARCGGWVFSVAFSSDGRIVASGDRSALLLWNSETGVEISTPVGYASWVNSVTFSPNPESSLLAFGSNFGVKLWDIATHTPIASLGEAFTVDAVAFSPDGSLLASASYPSYPLLTLWNTLTRKEVGTFAKGKSDTAIRSLSFSPDGAILATGHIGGTIKLWDVATRTLLATLEGGIGSFPGITSLSFSDDMLLASGSGADGTVLLWDLSELALDNPESVEVIPDPQLRAAIETALGVGLDDPASLSEMARLDYLIAREMEISDLTGLEFAINLHLLNLSENSILDISAVSGLTNLKALNLAANSISDISPLIANTGLGEGDKVSVRANPLSHRSIHTHIPTLQSRGVSVYFDDQAHPALLKISGDNQNGASLVQLPYPLVVELQDENGSVLEGTAVTFAVTAGGGTLSVTGTMTDSNGRAESTLTLGPNLGTNIVQVSAAGIGGSVIFHAISDTETPPIVADVNGDGSVNILDLVSVASKLGTQEQNLAADVNGDGVVNILDLVLVAGALGNAAAAPSSEPQTLAILNAVDVERWLAQASELDLTDPASREGVLYLEQLLGTLPPKETALLSNYPNPFNPETWIPYQLAEDAFVILTIYDPSGRVVRTLDVGHRIAAAYETRSKASYWDGRNEVGEPVASGVYFYHLSAGNYSAARKMLILK